MALRAALLAAAPLLCGGMQCPDGKSTANEKSLMVPPGEQREHNAQQSNPREQCDAALKAFNCSSIDPEAATRTTP
eukprot:gene18556-3318_t